MLPRGEAMTKHTTSLWHELKPSRTHPGSWKVPGILLGCRPVAAALRAAGTLPSQPPSTSHWNSLWPQGLCQSPALLPPQKCVSGPKEGDRTRLG